VIVFIGYKGYSQMAAPKQGGLFCAKYGGVERCGDGIDYGAGRCEGSKAAL